jgi:hypothetical protein
MRLRFRRSPPFFRLLVSGILLLGCPIRPPVASDAGGPSDAGQSTDAGPAADASQPADAGEPQDAGPTCDGLPVGVEPAWMEWSFDGGIPLDQVVRATAVVQCSYWSRCTPLAPYVLEQCAESIAQHSVYSLDACTAQGCAGVGYDYPDVFPNEALLQRIDAGLVGYDPQQELSCLEGAQAAPCTGNPIFFTAPCAHAFYVLADAGSAGALCWPFECGLDGGFPAIPSIPCQSDGDCTADGGQETPVCYAGACVESDCGSFEDFDGTCPAFVAEGQPCDSDPPFLGQAPYELPGGGTPVAVCQPGLTCRGLNPDGGMMGVCAQAHDVGEPCLESGNSGCLIGLVCACGICRIPPAQGSCFSESCQTGVAFCDTSDMCMSDPGSGEACGQTINGNIVCAAGLQCVCSNPECAGGTFSCQPAL